jgi:hypothetical protein
VPATPAAIKTSYTNLHVRITWVAPFANFKAIDKYHILIEKKTDGQFLENTTYCDGSSLLIRT